MRATSRDVVWSAPPPVSDAALPAVGGHARPHRSHSVGNTSTISTRSLTTRVPVPPSPPPPPWAPGTRIQSGTRVSMSSIFDLPHEPYSPREMPWSAWKTISVLSQAPSSCSALTIAASAVSHSFSFRK